MSLCRVKTRECFCRVAEAYFRMVKLGNLGKDVRRDINVSGNMFPLFARPLLVKRTYVLLVFMNISPRARVAPGPVTFILTLSPSYERKRRKTYCKEGNLVIQRYSNKTKILALHMTFNMNAPCKKQYSHSSHNLPYFAQCEALTVAAFLPLTIQKHTSASKQAATLLF